MRQHTELVVPFDSLPEYMDGIKPWLDRHAGTLQSVHVRLPVRDAALKCSCMLCAFTTERRAITMRLTLRQLQHSTGGGMR